jgi:hypothetical protein
MTQRERFRLFMSGRSSEQVLPFPISKTAWAAGNLGRRWATKISGPEIRDSFLAAGCLPSIILGEKEWLPEDHHLSLAPRLVSERQGDRRYRSSVMTPDGILELELAESEGQSITVARGPLDSAEGLRRLTWYVRELRANLEAVRARVQAERTALGEDCLITFFLPQPYELWCIESREAAFLLELDYPQEFGELQKEILLTALAVIPVAHAAGADLFLFGTVGTELYSPDIYERHILPSSLRYAEAVRDAGSFSSFHLCGRAQTFIDLGGFDRIPVDIAEGLALPPVGDVRSLREARERLPPDMIIRGSIDLDFLLKATPEQVFAKALMQRAAMGDHRYLLSGACDLLYGTPAENIHALVRACGSGTGMYGKDACNV